MSARWLGTLLALSIFASWASADYPYYPCCPQYRPAPDTCGPGYYYTNPYGMIYGPNYYLRPPFPPVQGIPPNLNRQSAPTPVGFPTHPYLRSPRDYFME
jgi:hypothetical protein